MEPIGKKGWNFFLLLLTIINLLLLGFLLWSRCKEPSGFISGSDLTTMIGLLVSCISIVITGFFVVLAINAYERIRDIEKRAEEVNVQAQVAKTNMDTVANLVSEIQESETTAKEAMKLIGSATVTCYNCAIYFIETAKQNAPNKNTESKFIKWRKNMLSNLYHMGLQPHVLDESTRISYILNLSSYGVKEDIERLEAICNSEEPKSIKDVAKRVLDVLKEKFK